MVLIDLSNFFNGLIREYCAEPDLIKAYFMEWLDMGLLGSAINPNPDKSIGTWIFYSKRAMGRPPVRLTSEEVAGFVKRQNRIPGTSAIDVGIPGEQSESFSFKCSNCETDNTANSQSEKGIDSSLITHLFDTMEHWNSATILSQDADYVPAVRALRKRGKIVSGAGFINRAAESLITECFEYKDINREYIQDDVSLFRLFIKGGPLSALINDAKAVSGIKIESSLALPSASRATPSWFLEITSLVETDFLVTQKWVPLVSKAEGIQKEFKEVGVHVNLKPPYLQIAITLPLYSPIKAECLRRARENYIDFEIALPKQFLFG
jgi:hypothetical protein